MKLQVVVRLAFISIIGLACAAGARAQSAAPAAAAPAAAAPASAASAPANPAAGLPKWAQEKLAASRDPKTFEQYYKNGRKVADFCANCHGPSGQSVLPEVPNLAGQNTIYVVAQLLRFSEGKRKQFFMERLMNGMTPDDKIAVAIYYTSQEAKSIPLPDPAKAAQGKSLYEKMCLKCHGAYGSGNEKNARLAGQGPEYLTVNIKRYRDGSTARMDEKMVKYTKSLTEDEIKSLVAYIGSMR